MLSETGRKVLRELVEVVKEKEVITYQELAKRLGQDTSKQPKVSWLFKPLGHVSAYTYNELGIFISLVVVNGGTSTPGPGFLQMAGLNILEDAEALTGSKTFINAHLKTLYAIDHKNLNRLLVN